MIFRNRFLLRIRLFIASFSHDVMWHVPGRLAVLRELCRVLKPRRRILFSDALVVGGMISHEEIAQPSSIGYYVFSPPGENKRLFPMIQNRDPGWLRRQPPSGWSRCGAVLAKSTRRSPFFCFQTQAFAKYKIGERDAHVRVNKVGMILLARRECFRAALV
jgi:SAM-dependent methyltransferase